VYYKLATLGTTGDGSNGGKLRISGTIGSFRDNTTTLIDAFVASRGSISYGGTLTGYGGDPTVAADLVVYQETNGTFAVWIKLIRYFTFDLTLWGGQTTGNSRTIAVLPCPTTNTSVATPTGTLEGSIVDACSVVFKDDGNVGIGTTEPTESLDIVGNLNLQKVSNTATIKLNSNVVTEFARSKKFIKYPRVAMTANSSGGYSIVQSTKSIHPQETRKAWSLFNNVISGGDGDTYHGSDNSSPEPYDSADGTYQEDESLGGVSGTWLYIQLPSKISLHQVKIISRAVLPQRVPRSATFLGSNNGTDWTQLYSFSDVILNNDTSGNHTYTYDVNSNVDYQYFGFVWQKVGLALYVNIEELELYGIPEYDPEAHGTDTIMRSIPNVPNTDWLEVYYDGQDYTSMPSTVTDKSGNGVNGTPTGVTFDSTWKAFVFDEADDYITFSPGKSGNYVFSASIWFKSTGSSIETLFTLNGDTTSNQTAWLNVYGDLLRFDFSNNSYKCDVGRSIRDGQWHHVSCTYNGDGSVSGREIYLDGIRLSGFLDGTSAGGTLNLTSSTSAQIGAYNHPSLGYIHELKGSIANFRLFNRALSVDEVWQLYAYQKEYFDVSPDVVTFKGGRLGIGTSEPRAVLDVRGNMIVSGSLGVSGLGGTTHDYNGYRVHAFTTSGVFTALAPMNVDILLVGGGGAGGIDNGGGGGAGGLVFRPNYSISSGIHVVTIGSGGIGSDNQATVASTPGGNTSMGTLQALGGGRGLNGDAGVGTANQDGGSGGGGEGEGPNSTGRGAATQTSNAFDGSKSPYGHGNRSGAGGGNSGGGGGGGGAGVQGSSGTSGTSGNGGAGGNGLYEVTYGETTYNFAEMFGISYGEILSGEAWFAGGGAGGNANSRTTTISGGKGGGGGNISGAVRDGQANTGGGGTGQTWALTSTKGGDGGTGILLLRYKI
jgi:hypothetical protein